MVLLQIAGCAFSKTRLFEPFNLIGKVELMTTFMKLDPIFVYAQIFPWLIFHSKKNI